MKATMIAVILAAIGVSAVVVHQRRSAGPVRASDARPVWPAERVDADAIDRIRLQRRGEPEMVFERSAGGWWQVEPFRYPMDAYSIRQLVLLAQRLEIVESLDPSALAGSRSTAALALDPPDARVVYEYAGGSITLDLGRRGVAGRAYLRIGGDEDVHVVSQLLHDRAVEMNPKEWRDRTLFRGVGVDADRIERVVGDERLQLVRERRLWLMIEPTRTRMDTLARDELFHALGRARCDGFILDQPEDLAPFGLDEPVASFAVTTSHATQRDGAIEREPVTQRLLVGAPIGAGSQDRFGMIEGRPVVIRLGAAVLGALFMQPAEIADPTASAVSAADVKSVRIRAGLEELLLERDLERWRAPGHDNIEVQAGWVDELLAQLTELRAPGVELKEYPLDLEVAVITLLGFDDRPLDTVRVVRHPETGHWAMENGDNVLRVFSDGLAMRLTAGDYGLAGGSAVGQPDSGLTAAPD